MNTLLKLAGTAVLTVAASSSAALAQNWPERPVTMIVAAGAGGGTDATARLLAADLEEIFGQPFNVVNRAEGGGIAGITELANAAPDGYTIGILFNYAPYRHLGMGNLTSASYTPIAQYNFDSAAIHVKADSEIQTLDEVIAALQENPQSLTIGCAATCPSSWSSAFSKVLIDQGIDITALRWVPSQGAAAGLQELVAGGVDVLTASVPEAASMLDAGEIRTLAVLSEERLDTFPDIPTAGEQIEGAAPGGVFRAVAGPAGLPEEVTTKLAEAIEQIYQGDDFQTAMNARGFGLQYRNSAELLDWMLIHEADTETVLRAAGVIE
ncbi:tripartite tricarboxylate transporter substrate binding protein [Arsenicitalea aurantiaca]|uniref:Tripartite tricarboxylate transporter substrate binding protein n=1 Tax=Arsenicitalea aurantiaca TaxID=1783274 RepID=A0A433X2E6_9HYPH|nr:tripartite tricarboxylate transporter substrate binding protein [Arsenicitalea aurantiaca]RUT28259.1 tripartite tricarboxylate transporter substrate binding protein [Arsenicitalea aurantiaca]